MKKVECYLIERASSSSELEKKVAEKIDMGWQPVGPMLIATKNIEEFPNRYMTVYHNEFYQTMVK